MNLTREIIILSMKNKTQIAIIDDDICATKNLMTLISDYPDFKILWTATSLESGKKNLFKDTPDLLFLDLELPDGFGLDFLKEHSNLLKNTYVIIFTGFYECYSEYAFSNNECDYLLKPILQKELDKSIQRFRHTDMKNRISEVSTEINNEMIVPVGTFAALTPINEMRIVRVPEIGYFRYSSSRRVWEVALKDRTFVQLKKGTNAESILEFDSQFVQTHQSYIINMRYLTLITNTNCVLFPPFEEDEILIGRTFRNELQEKFTTI